MPLSVDKFSSHARLVESLPLRRNFAIFLFRRFTSPYNGDLVRPVNETGTLLAFAGVEIGVGG